MLDSLDWQSIFLNISKSSQTLKLYNVVSDLSAFSVLFVLFLDQLPGDQNIYLQHLSGIFMIVWDWL